MSKKKGMLALLTGIMIAGMTTVSVHAVGLGFSNGYVPFKVTGTEEYTAFRELDDFSWRGDMIAVASVEGSSLSQGTYYFHIEPVLDDDIMTLFRRQYQWYKGMYLKDAEIVDIDFWDADGNAVSPKAAIYFQTYDEIMPYDCVFMYENGRFVPVKSSHMIDTLKVTPSHYARFVLADYTFTYTTTDDPGPVPTPDPTPVDVSSKIDDDKEVSKPISQESSEQTTSEYLPNNSTVEMSEVSDLPDGKTTSRDESKEETSHADNSKEEIPVPEESEKNISIPEESEKDISVPENNSMQEISVPDNSGNGRQEPSADKTSVVVSQPSQSSIISAPDGTAATGDSHTAAVLAVMGMTAAISTMVVLRKKKDRP